ncbi:MAG: DUF1549 and DUF1553 domain-containing protein [Gemmataceae bacterium]|nr:DUF1549 and DUF1553 domain-containing protein [Gemmataceae bacterium]
MQLSRLGCTAICGLILSSPLVNAQSLSARIDQLVAAKPDYAKKAAARSADSEFVRRIYLDLTGVTPSTVEARSFLADSATDNRQKLIDKLLASDGFVRHMVDTFDVLWMDRRADKHVKRGEWVEFLRASFAANKPYDELVSEILSADGSDPKMRAAARFYLDREGEPHLITKDVSRLFLGMNLQCAQCHDHPLVDAYKQDHYYGIYAFLNRSFLFADKGAKVSIFAEKGEGDVSYQSVFVAKVTKNTGPRIPDRPLLDEPKLEKGQEYVVPYKAGEKPQPKYSRRAQLAKEVTSPGNPRFARAAANRFWFMMMGRGIVQPVDLDHQDNPPSHPELLDLLAKEFAAKKFDIRALVKEIVLSETYQRSSEPLKGQEVEPRDFAVYPLRPQAPEQLALSMMQATGMLAVERKKLGAKATEKAVFEQAQKAVQTFVGLFGSPAGEPFDPTAYEATLAQSLYLRNGDLIRDWLTPRPGSLSQRLADLKEPAALAEELYLSVLTRMPTAEEHKDVADFLAMRADRPAAIQDLVWALLTSAEFRFNH